MINQLTKLLMVFCLMTNTQIISTQTNKHMFKQTTQTDSDANFTLFAHANKLREEESRYINRKYIQLKNYFHLKKKTNTCFKKTDSLYTFKQTMTLHQKNVCA